jgi:hypothetical protein
MASEPAGVEQPIRFGEGYEVDLRPRRLRRGSHVLKLERIPFEILKRLGVLPVASPGSYVSRSLPIPLCACVLRAVNTA